MAISNKKEFREDLFNFPFNNFLKHLQHEGNDRILFSGKFGIGKSFFLDHFFKGETQMKKLKKVQYNAFHLYPINYSIASNEDVFRYLKYDIITSFLMKGVTLKESDYSYIDSIPSYLRGNMLKVFATLIFMIPKIGKDVYDSYEKLTELKKDFEAHDEKARTAEGDRFLKFMESIEEKEGSPFENNVVTKLISTVLNRLKEETGQENILIIDDLDRIDPEHLFRLLNVFAAHLDESNGIKNKLGFDKVIIVCDINNLRNIFKAKYGIQTDFNGYIDKFYSIDIYHLDNREILNNISYEAFKNLRILNQDDRHHAIYLEMFFRKQSLPLILLRTLISYGFVSLRTLLTRTENKIEIDPAYYLKIDDMSTVSQINNHLFVHFKILKEIVGGYDILKDHLNRIPLNGFILSEVSQYLNQLLYYICHDQTLRAKGDITVIFNNVEFCLRIPENYPKDTTKDLILFNPKLSNMITDLPQYKYTIKEFNMLLNDFLDLLRRIEN